VGTKVHKFNRTVDAVVPIYDWAASYYMSGGNDATKYFYLGALPSYAEFTALFDCYRITGIKLTFIYSATSSNMAAGFAYANSMPTLGYVKDYDDATVAATPLVLYQYDTYKERRLDNVFKVFFKPRLATSCYSGGAFSGYMRPSGNPWIDSTSTDVQYYGIKWFIDVGIGGAGATQIGRLKIVTKYYLECKDVM